MALAVDLLGNLPRIRRPAGRRIFPFVFAVLLISTLLLVHAPEAWLPFSLMNRSDIEQYVPTGNMTFAWPMAPEEWDWPEIETALADGVCRFVSPLQGLTEEERILAATMEFEETTPGVVRAKGGSHPILGLLHRGEERWRQKVARQSMTLKEAADKYRQKWNRPPPKGFDKWYEYARSRNVLLIDEYDEVMRNILPFYGLEISSMQDRLDEVEALDRITVFAVENGVLRVTNPDSLSMWPEMESGKLYSVLQPIQHLLPDVTFAINSADQPRIILNASVRDTLSRAALDRTVVEIEDQDLPRVTSPGSACGPAPEGFEARPSHDATTFIDRHKPSMNPCSDRNQLDIHGVYLNSQTVNGGERGIPRFLPLLSTSTTFLNGDIAFTPWRWTWDSPARAPAERPWEAKRDKLFWQGRSTGLLHDKQQGRLWRQSHRERLVALAHDQHGRHVSYLDDSPRPALHSSTRSEMSKKYLDISFGDNPIQCTQWDETCAEMAREYKYEPVGDPFHSDDYKYLIDPDGNSWSTRMRRLASTNNVLLKPTIFPEYYMDTLAEWFTYIPSKIDYSDILSIMKFFAGDKRGTGHDEVARRIAHNSMCWVQRAWREEDAQVYMYRLLIEFARAASKHRDDGTMDYELDVAEQGEDESRSSEDQAAWLLLREKAHANQA